MSYFGLNVESVPAAVATSSRHLRILTVSGIQLSILSLSGPTVAMVAQADLLAVVYHGHHARAGMT